MMKTNIDRKKLMQTITRAGFAMDDVKLFLDTHPNCREALEFYQEAKEIRDEAWDTYTQNYGPLSSYEVDNYEYWDWNEAPLPWEGGNC
jgi:spore coat protein JB